MIKVLIADDHPVVRIGMKQIIEEAPDMIVANEASDGAEVIKKVFNNYYDIVLLDISMPGRDGLDILMQLKEEKPDLPILILSIYPEEEFAIRALKTGASGYLTKKSAPYELVTAIRKVSIGKRYISSSLADILASYLEDNTDKKPHENLSNREFQVMLMICSGKTIKEISEELSLSVTSISTYRIRILKKMNLKNNIELAHYAIKNHLVH